MRKPPFLSIFMSSAVKGSPHLKIWEIPMYKILYIMVDIIKSWYFWLLKKKCPRTKFPNPRCIWEGDRFSPHSTHSAVSFSITACCWESLFKAGSAHISTAHTSELLPARGYLYIQKFKLGTVCQNDTFKKKKMCSSPLTSAAALWLRMAELDLP